MLFHRFIYLKLQETNFAVSGIEEILAKCKLKIAKS